MTTPQFGVLQEQLQQRDLDADAVVQDIKGFTIETPSWGYGNSGTRFKVFAWPGAAGNLHEKLADAGASPPSARLVKGDLC